MPRKRSLADLYVVGKELTFDDGHGQVSVWIQKMNPVEASTAMRRSDAARARKMSGRRDSQSEDYLAVQGQIETLDRDEQVDLLCAIERLDLLAKIEEELSLKDEWAKDNYLQGLRDAWREGVNETFIDDPDDKEAARVHSELNRFLDQVNMAVDERVDDHRLALTTMTDDEVIHTVTEHFYKQLGDAAWLDEFQRCQIWLGTRDPDDHKVKLFSTRQDVDEIQLPLFEKLREACQSLIVEPAEGKDSAGIPPSSDSSESLDKPETGDSSGQGG
jgi:hypothetical protein